MSESEKIEDMEFMMEIMEARETIDDATQGDAHDVERLMESNDGMSEELFVDVSNMIYRKDCGDGRGIVVVDRGKEVEGGEGGSYPAAIPGGN